MTNKDDNPTQKTLTPRTELGDSDDKKRHEIFTRMAIKSVAELRKHLDPNSIDTGRIYPLYIPKARDYVISGMMNEVEKAAISSMLTSNFILESNAQVITDEQRKEQEKMKAEMPELEGNIYQSRIDEMVLWERKLTEQLVDIVGFRHVRKDDYYRHYALLREMERLEKISSDFKHYHGAENKNIEHQLTDLKNEADELLAKLDPVKCWYVEAASSKKNARYKIASFKLRLDRVLPWMTPNQRLMAGISYGEYSVQSSNLHPGQAKIKDEKPTMKALDNHFMRVTMLSAEVVIGAMDAMSMHNKKGWLGNLAKANKANTYPATLIDKLTKPGIEKGDFVLAYGDLAEVVKVNKTTFGYRSFRVRYLERAPIPSIPIDEMPARYVKLYQKRKPIADEVVKLLTADGAPKPSTRLINTSIRKTILDFWSNMGGKEFAYGKKDEGFKKMGEYLEKQKAIRKQKSNPKKRLVKVTPINSGFIQQSTLNGDMG